MTFVARTPFTQTLLTPVRLVPVNVSSVPPAASPEVGESEPIVGGVPQLLDDVTTIGGGLGYAKLFIYE